MPELRKDPVTARWVIVSQDRAARPNALTRHSELAQSKLEAERDHRCPFCPGNEHMTPPEITSFPSTTKGWQLRVIPNLYPALTLEAGPGEDGDQVQQAEGIYEKMDGVGVHEVIIEVPTHRRPVHEMSIAEIEEILRAYQERLTCLQQDPQTKQVLIFRNSGRAAGATLVHPHSQIVATPLVPQRIVEEIKESKRHYEEKGRCLFCDILRHECAPNSPRLVREDAHFVVFTPFASRFPYECQILPKTHQPAFAAQDPAARRSLAETLRDALYRLANVLNAPPYNYIIHTAPVRSHEDAGPYYHWHIEILPRIVSPAGFEWGSGVHINPVPPEVAAAKLRKVAISVREARLAT